MIKLLQQIDLSKQLSQQPQLLAYIKDAAKQIEKQQQELILKYKKPQFDEDLENHLIVTNIPDITGKEDKFLAFFKQFLDKKEIGDKQGLESLEPGFKLVNNAKVYNKTLYLIYKTPLVAKKAYQKLHLLKFDKQHTLACFTVKQFKDVQKINKQHEKPNLFPRKELVSHNLDQLSRDQFMFTIKQTGSRPKIVLNWFDHIEKKIQQAVSGQWDNNMVDDVKNVVFSSKGGYIAICEPHGVRILGGDKLTVKGFYPHQGVTEVIFSPNDTYMVSYNKNSQKVRSQQCFKIWAVEPQINLRQIKTQGSQSISSFQFNREQSRIAVAYTNQFAVYSCDTIQNLKKQFKLSEDDLINQGKFVKAPNIQKIAWLPDNVSVVCVCYELNPAINAHPSSKIFSYNTKTREQKKWKAIGQNIKKAQITISNKNDWVSVSFKKIQKKNLSISVIYIVNLLKKDIETQVVQFKENVVSVSWDKLHGRFGVVYEIPTNSKTDDVKCGVHFYQIQVKDKVQQATKIGQISQTTGNRIILAQNGTFFALYNTSPLSWGKYKYTLGSFTKDQNAKKINIQIIKQNIEIPYMTYFEMDQSGRFILAGTEKTYQIWTTSGELIKKDMFNNKVENIKFRPRYATRLTTDLQNKIQQREKQIRVKYEQQDKQRLNTIQTQKQREKLEKKNNFLKYLSDKKNWYNQFKKRRDQLRGFNEDDPKVVSAKYVHQYTQRQIK